MKSTSPVSEHFELIQIAEGVFAALGIPGGAAYSNGGIIDLGHSTMIFDTFDTPQAAEDLKAAAEQLMGRPVTYVINSHAHADHWLGNQVFDSTTPIIATHKTRELMPPSAQHLKDLKEDPTELEQELQQLQERLQTETDPNWRAATELTVSRIRHRMDSLDRLVIRLPNWTFERDMVFHGKKRRAELLTRGKGHTDSDAYLVLPEDRIIFMGDLGFFQTQPYMVYCDPLAWQTQLEQMERSDAETFVPGHGPLGTSRDLALMREYIIAIEEMVAAVIQANGSVEDALRQSLPAPFDGWLKGGMTRFEANVRSTYSRLKQLD